MEWLLADAKNRFSEVVNKALMDGPQTIRRRNDRVVLLSQAEYEKLTREKPDFKTLLFSAPYPLDELDLSRDQSPMRDVEL